MKRFHVAGSPDLWFSGFPHLHHDGIKLQCIIALFIKINHAFWTMRRTSKTKRKKNHVKVALLGEK